LNPNKPASDQLVSVGLGLRYQSGKFGLTADWGHLVTGSSLPLSINPTAPQAGANKIHVSLMARF
ncbi:MAG: hypothetical protein PHH58_16505, partial [Rhodoferax sp.]|nr:hypothetical protein [Rhodoferax sp.]